MPERIIRACIFGDVKPFQLLVALMARDGLNSSSLAAKLKRPALQTPIWRFTRGIVPNPKATTVLPIAGYFKVPVEAFFDERTATAVAKDLGLEVVEQKPIRSREKKVSEAAMMVARWFDMAEDARQRLVQSVLKPETSKDRELQKRQEEFEKAVEQAYQEMAFRDSDGITGNTASGPLDETPPIGKARPHRPQPKKQLDNRHKPTPPGNRTRKVD